MTNVGIDVAKEVHWVCAVDADGVVLLNHSMRSFLDVLLPRSATGQDGVHLT
jgi:hypothetical protein